MAAVTGTRKRRSIDPNFDPSTKSNPSSSLKSPKTAAIPSSPQFTPQLRPFQGPQRILKAFSIRSLNLRARTQLGIDRKARKRRMGNVFSVLFQAKEPASSDQSNGAMGLEAYKRLVEGWRDWRSGASPRFSRAVSDLRSLTRKDEEPSSGIHVLYRKVEDARKVVLDSVPLYKKLYSDVARRYDDKLSSLEFEVKVSAKKASAFRVASAARERKHEEDLHDLFYPLTDVEDDIVVDAMLGGNSREVLVIHEASNIEITRVVLQCLDQCAWLNDEVINLYLELLKERENREPERFLKCHFFNTFFYKKLINGRNGYDYKAVRRWTSKKKLGYALIECDKIFIPIHKNVHWCSAVIDVKEKSLTYLDSLGGRDTAALRILAKYLMDEAEDKSGRQIDAMSWKQETIDDLPLQRNGYDCGMFMLKYADLCSRGLSFCFNQQEHMPYFRKRTALEILRLRAD